MSARAEGPLLRVGSVMYGRAFGNQILLASFCLSVACSVAPSWRKKVESNPCCEYSGCLLRPYMCCNAQNAGSRFKSAQSYRCEVLDQHFKDTDAAQELGDGQPLVVVVQQHGRAAHRRETKARHTGGAKEARIRRSGENLGLIRDARGREAASEGAPPHIVAVNRSRGRVPQGVHVCARDELPRNALRARAVRTGQLPRASASIIQPHLQRQQLSIHPAAA